MQQPFTVYEWTGAGIIAVIAWGRNFLYGIRRLEASEQMTEYRFSLLWLAIDVTFLIASMWIAAIGFAVLFATFNKYLHGLFTWGLLTIANVIAAAGILLWINNIEVRKYLKREREGTSEPRRNTSK